MQRIDLNDPANSVIQPPLPLGESWEPPQAPELRFWLAQVVFWSAVTLLHSFVLIPFLRPTAPPDLSRWVVLNRLVTGLVVSSGLRVVYVYLARQDWPLRRILFRGVLTLFLAAILELTFFSGFMVVLNIYSPSPTGEYHVTAPVPVQLFHRIDVLTVWSLLYLGFFQAARVKSAELRVAEAESALRTSELNRLESQLQPHFLFNALTAILACRHDPAAVAQVTNGLSEHLRYCLGRQGLSEPLEREIDALTQYLHVQRARFGPNLVCTIDCTDEARAVPAPPMLVSPLLDNALKHGGASNSGPLHITVDCCVVDATLQVTVTNSGTWIVPGSRGRLGTGLANLRGRLQLQHGAQAQLICEAGEGQVRARISLPVITTTCITTHRASP